MIVHGRTGRWCWSAILLLAAGCATTQPRGNVSKKQAAEPSAVPSGFALNELDRTRTPDAAPSEEVTRQAEARSQVEAYVKDLGEARVRSEPEAGSAVAKRAAAARSVEASGAVLPALPTVNRVSVTPVSKASAESAVAASVTANAPAGTPSRSVPQRSIEDQMRSLEQRVATNPGDVQAQLRLRYLYLSEGLTDKALAVPQNLDPERAEVLLSLMKSVVAAEQAVADPSAPSPRVLTDVASLQQWADSKASLEIPRLALCATIHSYGRFDAVPDDFFVAGNLQPFLLYCELQHFSSARLTDGEYQTRIAHRLELFTAAGQSVWKDDQDMPIQDTCLNRRRDFFFNRLVSLPKELDAGDFVLKVTVEDRIGRQTTEASVPVRVTPRGWTRRG